MRLSRFARFARTAAFALAAAGACATSGGSDSAPDTEECKDACAGIAAADCGDVGSDCVDRCVHQPTTPSSQPCAAEYDAYVGCYWRAPAYGCDGDLTTPVGCDDEIDAVRSCTGGPDAGGAAGAAGAAAGAGGAAGEAALGTAGVGGA